MEQFDYIIVGAGSAGCVLAERLSADPSIRVLLLEAGAHDRHWLVRMPKGSGKTLRSPRFTAFYQTDHHDGEGAAEIWARGGMIGGSSSVNGMIWVRGQPEDYDRLEARGNPGWGWRDMAPYFRRLEDHGLGASETRGIGGPIKINTHPDRSRLADAFISAGKTLGIPEKADLNTPDQEGIGYLQLNIDGRGSRWSAARGFLAPARARSNLRIETGAKVEKLLIQNGRAVGVSAMTSNGRVEHRANLEVILSASSIETPKILQLSGIGPAARLRELNIPILADLPGVGMNMREHRLLSLTYRLKSAADSQNRCYNGIGLARSLAQYLVFGRGPMAHGAFTAGAFVRSQPGFNRPDGQFMFAPWSRNFITKVFDPFPGMHAFAYVLRPTSQGRISIRSGNPADPPHISPAYLKTDYDRERSISLIRQLRALMEHDAISPLTLGETEGSNWAQSDGEIVEAFIRQGSPGYHACGTCAMGDGDDAVVDSRLRVRGIDRLRVVDLSVFPEMLSGNTNAPVMALALKAADLIREDRARS